MARIALLIVDVQRDFCPGGSLPVVGGDEVVRPLSRLASVVAEHGGAVFASRDWHPPISRHFEGDPEAGKPGWPVHCVQDTPGASFHPDLHLPEGTVIVSTGMDPDEDGYSAFEGSGFPIPGGPGQPLASMLRSKGVERLYIGGLATDYCVRASALDAIREGFEPHVLLDAIRAVDLQPGDGERAIAEMKKAGVQLSSTKHAEAEIEQAGLKHPSEISHP